MEQSIGCVTFDELRPECNEFGVKRRGFVFRNKAHAEHVLTGCPNIHGEWVIDCLHAETLSIELSKDGRDCVEAVVCFFPWCLFTKDLRTGLAVSLNVEMSSKTIECGFDLVEESLEDRVRARSSDGSGGSRDQDKCISEILWLDPKVPVIEVGKELGTIIKQSANVSQDEAEDRISGRREATGGESLINPNVGSDLGVGGLGVSRVPRGEDGSEVWISVFNGRETIWKAALRSKAARVGLLQDTEWSDHGVGTIRASHTRACCDGEEDL